MKTMVMFWMEAVHVTNNLQSSRNVTVTWGTNHTTVDHKNLEAMTCKLFCMIIPLNQYWNWLNKNLGVDHNNCKTGEDSKSRKIGSTWIIKVRHWTASCHLHFDSCSIWKKKKSFCWKIVTGECKMGSQQ